MSAANVLDMLPVSNGQLTIDANSAPGGILADQLARCTNGNPIQFSDAVRTVEDGTVMVTGTTDFLNVANLPATATATLDAKGQPVVTLRFTLIDGQPGPNAWKFSRSFPDLPPFFAQTQASQQTTPPLNLLDTLILSDAAFVITTGASETDTLTGAPLQPGLNFVSRLTPTGLLGLLGSLLTGGGALTLFGLILIPKPTETTLPITPLPLLRYPWQLPDPVPGISLLADLGVEQALGHALRFYDVGLRIYTPTTEDWAAANPTYIPALAASAKFDIPSAGLSLDISAIGIEDADSLLLSGLFDGVSLSKLSQLLDVAGGDDLATVLPEDVQQGLDSISQLSLQALSLQLGTGFIVQETGIIIGIPNLNTKVLPGFTVDSLLASFDIADPFGTGRALALSLGGGVDFAGAPFDIAIELPAVEATTRLKDDVTLPLADAFNSVSLPAPPDLSINEMQFEADQSGNFCFGAAMAEAPAWTLDLGPTPLTVAGVTVFVSRPVSSAAIGSFSGAISLGNLCTFFVAYTTPGDFIMRADLPELKLSQLIAWFDELGLELPPGFDFDLKQSYVLIETRNGGLTFSVATTIEGLGLLAFTVQKQTGWGFAVGLDLDGVTTLAAIPGLEILAEFESFVGLDKLMLVASSLEQTGFTFPDMADFNAPSLGSKNINLPPQASGLVRGLNIYAALSTAKNAGFHALAQFLGVALDGTLGITLAVSLPDPATNSKLFFAVSEVIQQGITLTGELGVLMQSGEVGAFLTADVQTQVQGQPVRFDVTAAVLENGVLISGTMQGSVRFDPVQLSNLALVIGIDFEAIPSLGIAATIDVSRFDSSVAIFFDSTDPAKSLLSGAVSNLSLRDVAQVLAEQQTIPSELDDVLRSVGLKGIGVFNLPVTLATALDNRDLATLASAFKQYGNIALPATSDRVLLIINSQGAVWHVTDMSTMLHYSLTLQGDTIAVALQPQFYVAPQPTFIGAIQFPQAIHVVAEIDYLVLQAQLTVLINPSQGIAADVDIAPLVIYKPDFFAVNDASGQSGPRLSLSTYNQPGQTDPQLRAPHFLLSGSLHLLGVDVAGLYVSINTHGLDFQVSAQVNAVLHLDLRGNFDSFTRLDVQGGAKVGVSGTLDLNELGRLDVNVDVNGTLTAGYRDKGATASFKGSFVFQGISCNIPTIALDVDGPALQHITDTLWVQVTDIINKLLKDSSTWLTWVNDKVIVGAGETAEEVGQVLASVYHLSSDDIAKQTSQILHYGADDVAKALSGAGVSADEAARTMERAGYEAEEIAEAIPAAFPDSHINISIGHADVPASPHADTPQTGHVDIPSSGHADVKKKHADVKIPHISHTDTHTPHTDIGGTPHVDTPAVPHGDLKTPHVDTGTHIDT